MIKSCKIKTTDGVTSVFNAEGSFSKLYTEALEYTQDVQKAIKIWAVTQTNEWNDQMDSKEEPSLSEALRFIDNLGLLSDNIPTLSEQEVGNVTSIMNKLGTPTLQEFVNKMNNLFQPKGYFEINKQRLTASGLYSREDVESLNVKDVKDILAKLNIYALDNTIEIVPTEVTGGVKFKDLSTPKNMFGFHNVVTHEQIAMSVAQVTDDFSKKGVEDALLETEYADAVDSRTVVDEVVNFLSDKVKVRYWSQSGTKTETTVTNTIVENADTFVIDEQISFLSSILPTVWESNQKNVKNYLKKLENSFINFNLDVIGISDQSLNREGVIELLTSSVNLLNNPTEENIRTFSERKDTLLGVQEDVQLRSVEDYQRNYSLVEVSHNSTQDELFEQGLIKVGEDLYHQVLRDVSKDELYEELYQRVVNGDVILDAKYFNETTLNLKDPLYRNEVFEAIARWINSRDIGVVAPLNGEEISLYQVLFGHTANDVDVVYREVENTEYLKTDFVSDFYNYILKEKRNNSTAYNDVLKWFEVQDGDLVYTKPGAKVNLDQIKYKTELTDYATIKKEGSIKVFAPNETSYSEDIYFLNNPSKAQEVSNREYVFENDFLITRGQSGNNYVRQGGKLYRKLLNDVNASVYGQVLESTSNIYKDTDTNFTYPLKEAEKALERAYELFGGKRTQNVNETAEQIKTTNKQEVFNFAESELSELIDNFKIGDVFEYKGERFNTRKDLVKHLQLEGVLDQLMKTKLASKAHILSPEQIQNKLIELGVDADVAFQIIGEIGARNLDAFDEGNRLQNLEVAKQMQLEGLDPLKIRLATGWEVGADGKWRYEILEGSLKIRPSSFTGILSDVLDDTELFTTYPQLKDLRVKISLNGLNEASYGKSGITVNTDVNNTLSLLIHEVQHAIQDIEGFAKGGTPIALENYINEELKTMTSPLTFPSIERGDKRRLIKDIYREKGLSTTTVDSFYFDVVKDDINILEEIIEKLEILNSEFPNEVYTQLIDKLDEKIVAINTGTYGETSFNHYRILAGEVEARNVQTRSNMTPEQRRNTLLSSTEDVLRSDQTIQFQQNGITLLPNGFYHNGQVYINRDTATLSTLVHEFGHAFNQLLKNERPEFYQEGLRLVEEQGQQYVDFVKANQPNLEGEALLEEALTQAIGDAGQRLIEKQSGLFKWLQEAWNSIKDMLGLSSYTIDQVRNMSLQEYTNAVAVDLLRGESLGQVFGENETNFQINATEQELQQIKNEAIANGTFMKAPNGKDTNLNERQWLQVRSSNFRSWFGDWQNDPQNASKVVDSNGEPMVTFHGTNGEFTTFDPKMIGINANAEGAGFYFTDDKAVAEGYMNTNKDNPSLYEVFLNVRNPIYYGDKMFKKGDVRKIIKQVIKNEIDFDPEGVKDYKDSFMSNFVDIYSIKEARAIEEVVNILMDDETKIDFISGLGNAVGSQSMVLDAVNKALGYDSTFAKGYSGEGEAGGNIYITWSPNQIKSATDNVGTFSSETNDIRYQKDVSTAQKNNQKLATITKANEIGLELFPTQEKINEITQEMDACGI